MYFLFVPFVLGFFIFPFLPAPWIISYLKMIPCPRLCRLLHYTFFYWWPSGPGEYSKSALLKSSVKSYICLFLDNAQA